MESGRSPRLASFGNDSASVALRPGLDKSFK